MPRILVIDNYDSFTYNLVQYLGMAGAQVDVRRNDSLDASAIAEMAPDGILLSPGPCTPTGAGVCLSVIAGALGDEAARAAGVDAARQSALARIPIFGVCLGHQSLGHVAGAPVVRADRIMHGKASMVRHDGAGVFEGMPNPFRATRYHSLVVDRNAVPAGFRVTATAEDDGEIMGLRHETLPIEGVQFHPESVLTEEGLRLVSNFVRRCAGPVPAV